MSELSDAIFELIVAGDYKPGEKLSENELAERFGVSRTPVREALKTLGASGIISIERHKGARVVEYSTEAVEALYAARAMMEPYAARLASENMSDDDILALRQLAEDMYAKVTEDPSIAEIALLNNAFHSTILSHCPNSRVAEMTASMLKPVVSSLTFRKFAHSQLIRSALHHIEIVDAIAYRDPEWVESIMRAHIRAGYHSAVTELA
ncbi:GntR family transcriptional regulator [Mycolicibacterium smegmatis]|uniref:Transcriptional regulator, GntR family protein n=1 Tax=Mycolicibacterium smegmatis (strain MKD8) TaxID=1214915 RepID=A0A2U9PKB9_MYCSE|nr:GntR family transcriptional regulator [Mycolicibacterium smegmatis]AWT52191.1 transcriptional regulator, GntR family protein [Mycolicibacterium smegmatis MKD8]